jgi:hypothetical protein
MKYPEKGRQYKYFLWVVCPLGLSVGYSKRHSSYAVSREVENEQTGARSC